MLATEILTQDHRLATGLIERLEGVTTEETQHQEIFNQLNDALELYMREEKEIYYPAIARLEEFEELMEECLPEHEIIRENLAHMRECAVSDEVFQSLLAETKAVLEMHIKDEENEVFPKSIELLGSDKIDELGDRIEQMKGESGMSQSAGM